MTLIQLRKKVKQSIINADERLLVELFKVVKNQKGRPSTRTRKSVVNDGTIRKTGNGKTAYRLEERQIERGLNTRLLETWGGTDKDYAEFRKMKTIA